MIKFLRISFFIIFLNIVFFTGECYPNGAIIPTDTSQADFLKTYKLMLYTAYVDYRFTSSTLDSVLFPKWGEQTIYWVKSGPKRGSFVFPDAVPSGYSTVTNTPYTSFNWQNEDLYSIQYKIDPKKVAIFKSLVTYNNNTVNWESVYFKNLFDSYLYDNTYCLINEKEIDTSGVPGSTQLLIIPSFNMNGTDNKFYIDSIFKSVKNLKTRFDSFLSRGGVVYAEGNAVYFMEKLGYLADSAVNFDKSYTPDPKTNYIRIKFNNSNNPLAFVKDVTGDSIYTNSVPTVKAPQNAEVIATLEDGNPVAFVMNNVNNGRIICNTALPTIGGINQVQSKSRQLQWSLNTIMYAFCNDIDVTRSVFNDLPDSIAAGKNAISYDRLDTFEIRIKVRNTGCKPVNNIRIDEYFKDYFKFVDVPTQGVKSQQSGSALYLSEISVPAHSEKIIVYRLSTPKPEDPIHDKVNNYISWASYIYVSYGVITYTSDIGTSQYVKYRDYADMMFSAKLVADADLNWKNFLGLYYQPFKVFMIMENKERTNAENTKYVQYIPKDVPFYWTDNSINIPILKTPGGKFVDVLKGSNDQNNPQYDMDGDGHPDVWLDTASIYPKGYTIVEDSVYWLNPWEHFRTGDTTYYEDINHDGIRAKDLNGDGIVDIEAPGDKIRVWKVTWNIGRVTGYQYFDPYCYYEIWVDPPDLVPLSAGVGEAYGKMTDKYDGMFYPYTKDITKADLKDKRWENWMEHDSTGKVIWKQLINQKIHNYEGFTFIDTLKENYRLSGFDHCVGTVPQPHREFIAVLSLGGEEIDMTHPTSQKSLYSNLTYKTIFNETRTTPIRSTYTYYAPLPNPLQFEYLSNNYTITDSTGKDTLKFLPEWGSANLTFDVDASTEYSYYWIRNAGHDVMYNDPSLKIEGKDSLGDGVFGYMIYDIPKGMGGYKITLPKNPDGTYNTDAIVEVDGHKFEKWLDNPHTKDSIEIWEDPFEYHVYIPQLLIPPALDDDNHDGIDDWIDDRGDRFASSTGFLHDLFMLDDGEKWKAYPKVPFKDDIYGMVDSGWYAGPDNTYGDDFFEKLGKTHFKIHAQYQGMGKEGPIDISKGGWLVVEEIFGGSPWVIFSHTLSGFSKGVDYRLTSQATPTLVKYGVDTAYIKHIVQDVNEPHYFNANFDPWHVSYGYGEATVTTTCGGKDPCNLIIPAYNMPAIIDPVQNHKTVTLIPNADSSNPMLKGYPKTVSGTFIEAKIEVMNGTDDNWINTTVKPVLPSELKNSKVIMSYVAYPRPLVPAMVDPATGKVIQGGDDLGTFKAGWRFNQPEGEVLIKMGDTLPLMQPSRRAYFVYLISVDESLPKGVYNIDFTIDGSREYYDGTNKGKVNYEVPALNFSISSRDGLGTVTEYQKFVIGKGDLTNIKTKATQNFTGLQNVKWSNRDIYYTDFDTLSKTLPAYFDKNTGVETIDLSSFKDFPKPDMPYFYILEEGKVNSYNSTDKIDLTYGDTLNYTNKQKGPVKSGAAKVMVTTSGPKINLFKKLYAIDGQILTKKDTILTFAPNSNRDIETQLIASNLGNDLNENTILTIYPGIYFEPDASKIPTSCKILDNGAVEVALGSFIPGEIKNLMIHYKPKPSACLTMFDSNSVISAIDISYNGSLVKGGAYKDVFAYPDNSALELPARDLMLYNLSIDKAQLSPGSTGTLKAEFRNGLVISRNVELSVFSIINEKDTVLIGKQSLDSMLKMEKLVFTVDYTVPDTAFYIKFFSKVKVKDTLCDICENNNIKTLSVPFTGPKWILNVSNSPNPYIYKTEIHYSLPRFVTNLNITIFSSDGKEIGKLNNCPGTVGNHSILWVSPDVVNGLYLLKIDAIDDAGVKVEYWGRMIKN